MNNNKYLYTILFIFTITSLYGYNLERLKLYENMNNTSIDKHSYIWIINKNKFVNSNDAIISFLNNKYKIHDSILFPPIEFSGKYQYWILTSISNSLDSFPLAIVGYGMSKDSIWFLDSNYSIIKRFQNPGNNQITDYTSNIKIGHFDGVASYVDTTVKYILFKIINHRYAFRDLPRLFDAKYYEINYIRNNANILILYFFSLGIIFSFISYHVVQYIKLKDKIFILFIAYMISLALPMIDALAYMVRKWIIISDLWFYFKIIIIFFRCVIYVLIIQNLSKYYNYSINHAAKFIVPISIIFFTIDIILQYWNFLNESYHFYLFTKKFTLVVYLGLMIVSLFKSFSNQIVLRYSTILIFCTEALDYFFNFWNIADTILILGSSIQIFIFGLAYNQKIKESEMQQSKIKEQNAALLNEKIILNEKIRKEIANDIHDEVGSTITKISLSLQLAQIQEFNKNQVNEILHHSINNLKLVSEQIRELIFDMVNDDIAIHEFNSQIRNITNIFLKNTSINIIFELDDNLNSNVPYVIKRNLLFIIKESLHNVVKHSKATIVKIRFVLISKLEYELYIQNDGIMYNLNNKQTKNGNGLNSISARCRKINAYFQYSRNNTEFTMHIKGEFTSTKDINNSYLIS